jgi:hypothetical protein
MLIVLPEQMERTMQDETKPNEIELELLEQVVINLHNSARTLEQAFGQPGQLSDDIRSCADRLSRLLKRC